jgi:serine/threonine-protein kinase HipA
VMGEARAPGRGDLERLAADSGLPTRFAAECIERVRAQAPSLSRLLNDAGVRKATRERVVTTVQACARRCAA